MFLIKLFNYIKGYLSIEIYGMFTERFLNICARRGIHLWNVARTGKWKLKANISIPGFKMLRPIVKKSRCEVKILGKKGLPFIIFRHRNRKAFAVGVVICAALIYYMSTFVWVISINGNDLLSYQQIVDSLQESGVKTGMKASAVDSQAACRTMMTLLPEIGWIGINTKGSTVTVDIKERAVLPPVFEKDRPCNIVATKDGVITSIDVTNGARMASENDVVKKGQVLVSGAISSEKTGLRMVHADGVVFARTWYEKAFDLPMTEEVRSDTGKNKSKHTLKIFDFYVKLYISDKVDFADYQRESYVKSFFAGNNNILPVTFHYDKYFEQTVSERQLDDNEAMEKVRRQMDEECLEVEIVSRDIKIEDGKIKAVYECIENIGEKQDLNIQKEDFNDNNGENP